jgi:hypothetical protein
MLGAKIRTPVRNRSHRDGCLTLIGDSKMSQKAPNNRDSPMPQTLRFSKKEKIVISVIFASL